VGDLAEKLKLTAGTKLCLMGSLLDYTMPFSAFQGAEMLELEVDDVTGVRAPPRESRSGTGPRGGAGKGGMGAGPPPGMGGMMGGMPPGMGGSDGGKERAKSLKKAKASVKNTSPLVEAPPRERHRPHPNFNPNPNPLMEAAKEGKGDLCVKLINKGEDTKHKDDLILTLTLTMILIGGCQSEG